MTESIQNFSGKYPKPIWALFFSEMWERFCFYGMRGMLVLFMTTQLLMDDTNANLQYGATQAFVYAFTFLGGLLADKILGYRKSLFWGGLLMIVGSIILAINPKDFFFFGISFTIIGTGFFKPNISTMVGKLYTDNDSRRDAGFSLFYAGVNLGALIGGYVCVAVANGTLLSYWVPQQLRWNVAFGMAAVVMVVSLVTFINTQRQIGTIGISPLLHLSKSERHTREWLTYVASLLVIPLVMSMVSQTNYTDYFMYAIGPLALLYLFFEMRHFSKEENKKLAAALVFIIFSIFFWAFFEQSGGSLSIFAAQHLNNNFFGVKLDTNGVNNAANSLFVIIFASVIGALWLFLNNKNKEPNTVTKFGIGFLCLALGFGVFFATNYWVDNNAKTSLEVFTLGWLFITFGELCLSPIGMSAMTKLSPAKTQAVMMGMWFLASAYGQYFAGLLGANIAQASKNAKPIQQFEVYTNGYLQLGYYAIGFGVLLILIAPFIKKLMQGIK